MCKAKEDAIILASLHEKLKSGYDTFEKVWWQIYNYHAPFESFEFEKTFYDELQKRNDGL